MPGHHLILGEVADLITGEMLQDTHDERYRQEIARMLIDLKGYRRTDITPRRPLTITVGEKKAIVPIDFLIRVEGIAGMIIRFGPGSLVTRHRPSLAVSRLAEPYQIPLVVITNGEGADIVDGHSGKIIRKGLDNVHHRNELRQWLKTADLEKIPSERVEMESRIVYAYEIDDACPCDDTVCRLPCR
ncbi:MAG: hypothetical protein HKM93_22665 [Desulfobacteraceae bacterium]|nr:hypothetical protein [Desulfobacteraceae bacterium]